MPGCVSVAAALSAVVRFRGCGLLSACGSEAVAQRSDRRTSSDINTPYSRFRVGLLHADHGSTLVIARQTFAKIGHTDAAVEAATGNPEFMPRRDQPSWLQR